jgi:putrescine importer
MRYNGNYEYEEYYDDYDAYEEYEEPQPYFFNVRDLVFFCLAFMTPAASAILYGGGQAAAHGALAGSYIVALVFIFLTMLSYRRLGHAFSGEGSVLAYAGNGIHLRAGYYTGWTALIFYVLVVSSFLMVGAQMAAEAFAPVPHVFWFALIAIVSGIVVLFGQKLTSLALTAVMLGVIGITAIYILVCFMAAGKGAADPVTPASAAFAGTDAGPGAVMAGAAIACLAFLGLGSATTLSADAESPKRDTGKAMSIACVIAAALFFFQALASARILHEAPDAVAAGDVIRIAEAAGGAPMRALFALSVLLSSFGIGIAGITAASRMLRILVGEGSGRGRHEAGRGRGAGGFLSDILPQTGTPPAHVIACLAAAIVIAYLIPGRDAALAFDLTRFAGMLCFLLVNAASLIFFWFRKHDPVILRSIIIPAAGLITSLWAWINIDPGAFGIGVIFALAGVIIVAAFYLYERLVLGTEPRGGSDGFDAD